MDDLISRKAAIDALKRKKDKNAKGDMAGFYNTIIQNDIDALMQLPSKQAKPTFEQIKEYCDRRCLTIIANEFYHDLITTYSAQPERKNGRWLMGKCSLCGGDAPYYPMSSGYYTSDFCPNCGADMRGGEDEVN